MQWLLFKEFSIFRKRKEKEKDTEVGGGLASGNKEQGGRALLPAH